MKKGDSSTATIVSETGEGEMLTLVAPPAHQEEVDTKLDAAREQLLALRRQQEELERQKGELEELRRKQEEYTRGRAEMIDNLTRGLVTIERQQIESQRLADLCDKTTAAFRDYLDQLQAINDEQWTSATVRAELSSALATIDNARMEFNRARTKLDCLNPSAGQPALPAAETKPAGVDWDDLTRWMWRGAAASAPLILAGTIWLAVLLIARR